jgi:Rad3-related DNA helicase
VTTYSDFSRLDFDVTERRKTDEEIVNLVRQMFVELKQMREDLHVHIRDETVVIQHAFVDSDLDGHRAAHQAWIRHAEAKAAFWEKLHSTLVTSGVLAVLAFVLIAAWKAFLEGPK